MDFENAQRQIDSLQRTLSRAKESRLVAPHDPSLLELERIMLRKVGELEAAKVEARDEASDCLFFADDEELEEPISLMSRHVE